MYLICKEEIQQKRANIESYGFDVGSSKYLTVYYIIMMNKRFIETLNSFKEFMLSADVPNYVIRYCEQLNDVKWTWFYTQMVEAVMITDELEYLFYVLK